MNEKAALTRPKLESGARPAFAPIRNFRSSGATRRPLTRVEMAALVAEVKAEVLADVEAGRVPASVRSFEELHEHVDANEYGGLCDPTRRAWVELDDVIGMQEAVGAWLHAGCPR